MPRALWTGASGMAAQQLQVDVIANNIANVNTVGFRKERADFQDLYYEVTTRPGERSGDQGRTPTGTQIGTGVRIAGTTRSFNQGSMEDTGKDTDLAIEGDGFFQVQLPDGATTAYTRAGDFRIDGDGRMTTPDGYYLTPNITIPNGATQVSVATNGTVSAIVNGVETTVGQITLARFRNNGGLIGIGKNLFTVSESSGTPQVGVGGSPGFGNVRNRTLEKANVEVVNELVNMIVAQRAYEMNSKSISTTDAMLRTANDIIR